MQDEEKSNSSSKLVGSMSELVKAVPIYQDALQPMMQETGKALSVVGRAVNVALAPVRGMVWGAEKVEDWVTTIVAKKLEHVAPDQIITPDLSIAGPTIEALKFNGHKSELSEMFASVLAGAMQKNSEHKVHPSFVEKIKMMTTLDASLFRFIASKTAIPTLEFVQVTDGTEGHSTIWSYVNDNLFSIYTSLGLPEDQIYILCQRSIEHLYDLGLIEARRDGYLTAKPQVDEYKRLEETIHCSGFLSQSVPQDVTFKTEKSYINMTQLGKTFFEVIR